MLNNSPIYTETVSSVGLTFSFKKYTSFTLAVDSHIISLTIYDGKYSLCGHTKSKTSKLTIAYRPTVSSIAFFRLSLTNRIVIGACGTSPSNWG